MPSFGTVLSPIGEIGVTSDGTAIRRVTWRSDPPAQTDALSDAEPDALSDAEPDALLTEALAQLTAYFDGACASSICLSISAGRPTPPGLC